MTEQAYFEQFVGDDESQVKPIDLIPAFSADCPDCHGTGFVTKKIGSITLTTMCDRCFGLARR